MPSAAGPRRPGKAPTEATAVVLGRGRLGTSLAQAAGFRLEPARGGPRQFTGELVLLAVPDPEVAGLAREIRGAGALIHLSGALPLSALGSGGRRGSLHPYQSFPAVRPPEAFRGAFFAVDATDRELEAWLRALAERLGGVARHVGDEQRRLYHASAVLTGNFLVALTALGAGVLGSLGWSRDEARAAILPLLEGTLANLRREGLAAALIGPVRRGDAGTVAAQLAELEAAGLREAAAAYRILGLTALELAIEAGLGEEPARALRVALTGKPAATERRVT